MRLRRANERRWDTIMGLCCVSTQQPQGAAMPSRPRGSRQQAVAISCRPRGSRHQAARAEVTLPGPYGVVLIFLLLIALSLHNAAPVAAEALPKPIVGVTPFAELGSNLPPSVGEITAELLATEIAGDGRHTLAERTQLQAVLNELGWQDDSRVDDQTAVDAGRQLGAAVIVTGSVMKLGQNYTVAARFLDVATGEVLAAVSKKAANDDALAEAIPKIAQDYRRQTDETSAAVLEEVGTLLQQGRVETARERLVWITERYPRCPAAGEALLELARMDMKDRLYYDASERLNSLIDTFPAASRNSEALYRLGECYYLTVFPPREAAAAMLRDLDRILERWQNPGDPREAIRQKAALSRKARDLYKTALAAHPDTPYRQEIEARLRQLADYIGE